MKKGNSNTKRNGYIGLGVMILLAGATIFGSDPLYQAIDSRARADISKESSKETVSQWKDGTYSYEAPEYDENGYKDQVVMTIKGNAITSLTWDCIKEDGSKKSQLSMEGKYVMTENGPKWHEQAEAVVAYVLEHQGVDGLTNAEGYTDAIASVSINLNGFVNGVKDCLSQASSGSEETKSSLKDGTYSYEAPEYDENGYKDQVVMTIKGNAITSLTWDCIKEDGSKKSQLSMEGKYVMTENGPKWHEQAEAVVAYVLEHQGVDGLTNAEGYTDAIASVSINLKGFVNGVKDCLTQASR